MALVTLKEILTHATENNYAVGSFNAVDFNILRGLVAAAEQERAPIILNLGQGQFRLTPPELLAPIMVKMAQEASVPVVVHLDHGKDIATCIRALKLGFSSIMYDGSALSFEDNVKNTNEVIRFAKYYGASVEAEIGKVGNVETGDEDAVQVAAEQKIDQLTTPEEAEAFVSLTEVDALAVAFGTAHGMYRGVPKIDLARVKNIRAVVDVPLVMHGGSGLDDDIYREAILSGITKINYFTNMSHIVGESVKSMLNSKDEAYYHETILHSVEATKQHVAHILRVFGSAGKA